MLKKGCLWPSPRQEEGKGQISAMIRHLSNFQKFYLSGSDHRFSPVKAKQKGPKPVPQLRQKRGRVGPMLMVALANHLAVARGRENSIPSTPARHKILIPGREIKRLSTN